MEFSTWYRRTDEGVDYWTAWELGGEGFIRTGRVGEPATVERFPDRDEFAFAVSRWVRQAYAEGFRTARDEHADEDVEPPTVLVQWPRSAVPEDLDGLEELWDRVERWVDEELGSAGLGRSLGVDLSTELVVMAEAEDTAAAVRVLADSLVQRGDLPAGAVIAVREGEGEAEADIVRWPPERDGEDVSGGLPGR